MSDLGDKSLPAPQGQYVQLIKSYGPGHFTIADKRWEGPILVTDTFTVAWAVTRADELSLASLAPLKEAPFPVELLVVGCGSKAVFIAPGTRAALKAAGMTLEVVDTGSACRIYNVLLAEGRRVAAALIPL